MFQNSDIKFATIKNKIKKTPSSLLHCGFFFKQHQNQITCIFQKCFWSVRIVDDFNELGQHQRDVRLRIIT